MAYPDGKIVAVLDKDHGLVAFEIARPGQIHDRVTLPAAANRAESTATFVREMFYVVPVELDEREISAN
jgi:hypothetical protein